MLTLTRRRWGSIYSLWDEGVHGPRPRCVAHRQRGQDVRATGRMSGPSRDAGCPGAGAGCPGWQGPPSVMGRRISGSWAGCPAARDGPDVRADLVQLRVSSLMGAGFPGVGPDVRAGAGCLGPGRMSGSCSLSPVPLVVLLHPCTWGLVHHSVHLREGLLGT